MCVRLGDRIRVVWPTGGESGEAGFLEQRRPSIPAARQQPESVNEHDWCRASLVCALDLLRFVIGDRRHARWRCRGCSGAHVRSRCKALMRRAFAAEAINATEYGRRVKLSPVATA